MAFFHIQPNNPDFGKDNFYWIQNPLTVFPLPLVALGVEAVDPVESDVAAAAPVSTQPG